MATYVIRTKEKNKVSALYLYYYHNRLRTAFAVGYSINSQYLDTIRNKVTYKEPRYKEINDKVEEMEKRIDRIIAANPLLEPTAQWMKGAYLEAIREEAQKATQQAYQQKIEMRKEKSGKVILHLDIEELEEQKAKLEEQKIILEEKRKAVEANPFYQKKNVPDEIPLATLMKHYDDYVFGKNYKKETLKAYTAFRKLYFQLWINSPILKEARSNHALSLNPIHANLIYSRYFNRFLIEEMKYKNNTMGKTYKILKQYLSYLETSTDIKVNRQYTKFAFLKDTIEDFIIIDDKEFELIWEYRNQATQREEKVVYLMLFTLITGLRISEVLGNTFAIFTRSGKRYLNGVTYKNNSEALLPMWKEPRLQLILDKYNPNSNGILYKMNLCSAQEFNEVSKLIMKKIYAQHNLHTEPILQQRTALKNKVSLGYFYKWQLFTSRTCRRSAITRWRLVWQLEDRQIREIIETKKLEILEIYTSREKADKVKLLENI